MGSPTKPSKEQFDILLCRVRAMVVDETEWPGFIPELWLAEWLATPIFALGWDTPAEHLAKKDGLEHVLGVLGAIEHGHCA